MVSMSDMKQGIVILDNNQDVNQTAYTAFDIAARSGMSLIGAINRVLQDSDEARRLARNFDIGARAARVKASTVFLEDTRPEMLSEQFPALNAVLLSQNEDPQRLREYVEKLPYPIWIIPQQRTIRRILVVPEISLPTSPALALASTITRSWGVDLHLFFPGRRSIARELLAQVAGLSLMIDALPDSTPSSKFVVTPEDIPPPAVVHQIIQANLIDLVLIDRENTWLPVLEFYQHCACLVVVCPSKS
jgi:hypothetical protein